MTDTAPGAASPAAAPLTFGPRRIYLATSWRNPAQPALVARLRAEGHEVYDFRNPAPGVDGFSWRHCTDEAPPWSAERTREVLASPAAVEGFRRDFEAMQWADTCLMLQPCGRSAALELGWAAGAGKLTLAVLTDGQEPELMLKVATKLCTSEDEALAALRRYDPVAKVFHVADVEPRRHCNGCRFRGWDPDGAYCGEPHVAAGMPYGVVLWSPRVGARCPAPAHPYWQPKV